MKKHTIKVPRPKERGRPAPPVRRHGDAKKYDRRTQPKPTNTGD